MKNQRIALSGLLFGALALGACVAPTGTTVPPGENTTTKYVTISAPASHSLPGTLTATVTTATYGGANAPEHVMAVWVEDKDGIFVRTLGAWGGNELSYLKIWKSSQGSTDVDGVTGASLKTHGTQTVSWDLKDHLGSSVAAGTYKLKAEMNESSATSKTDEVSLTLTSP